MPSAEDCQFPQHTATSTEGNQDTNSRKDISCSVGSDASDSNVFEQLWTKRDRLTCGWVCRGAAGLDLLQGLEPAM